MGSLMLLLQLRCLIGFFVASLYFYVVGAYVSVLLHLLLFLNWHCCWLSLATPSWVLASEIFYGYFNGDIIFCANVIILIFLDGNKAFLVNSFHADSMLYSPLLSLVVLEVLVGILSHGLRGLLIWDNIDSNILFFLGYRPVVMLHT